VAGGAVVADDLESGAGGGLSGAQNVSPALCTQRWRGLRRHSLIGKWFDHNPKLLF
jgi:dihydrodipicolinate synthase/N-acetylneuraminate lyase